MLVFLALFSCKNLPSETQLFIGDKNNEQSMGNGYFLFSNEEVSCSTFKEGLESGKMPGVLAGQEGLLAQINYNHRHEAEGFPGTYGEMSYSDFGSSSDSGQSDSVYSTMTATAFWFYEEGVWQRESSGLQLTIDEFSSEEVKGNIKHLWVRDNFRTENCPSFDNGYLNIF